MKVYALTHIGRVRSVNQDAFYAPAAGEKFALVADGMGGHRAGEIASKIAVEEFTRWLRCAPRPSEEALSYAVSEANRAIYLKAKAEPDKAGMGTTLTALWIDSGRTYLAHVGDSRAYLLRDGELSQISRDHSLVAEMLERGEITPDEARIHPQRHYITRAIGTSAYITPDIDRFERRNGDVWLLCSDGLTNYVEKSEMEELMNGHGGWQQKISLMIELALRRGGADNITVLVIVPDGGAL